MLRDIDNFYLKQKEPAKSCLLALREIILQQDDNITAAWKYGMPFFCYNRKMFCYLWINKKNGQPYLGMVEGKHLLQPELIQEKRSRMKIMLFDPAKNLPVKKINAILQQAINLYKTGVVKIKK
jgi:hypothetical protein